MYLFFDTETTGVPKNYKASPKEVDNWPRIIQLAWALFDEQGILISSSCNLIRPNGWVIPKEKFWIDNGYSTEKSMVEGVGIYSALDFFISQIERCHTLVAHNMDFDLPIAAAEMIRAEMKATNKPAKFCTMKASTDICKIPGQYGKFKWPKLEELHNYLFGKGFDGAHDAMNDVIACANCFFEMQQRELIDLPKSSL